MIKKWTAWLTSRLKAAPGSIRRLIATCAKKAWQWIAAKIWGILGGSVILTAVAWGISDAYLREYFGQCVSMKYLGLSGCIINERSGTDLTEWLAFFGSVTGLVLLYRRTRNQDRQIGIQISKEIDDRFTAAVGLLASGETSARTGAIYALYHLAVDEKGGTKYREQIAQILCSYIRSKTQEGKYKREHKTRPSNEIQTTINLLFKDANGLKGIYQQFSDLSSPDLSWAYLAGANFRGAWCQEADFSHANCQGTKFQRAQCQGANFLDTQCQGAYFNKAQCQDAGFEKAHCGSAYFWGTHCQGAHFMHAECWGADFREAQCQGVDFSDVRCHFANFSRTHCQGAIFSYAHCHGACFSKTQCQGAYLDNTHLEGARSTVSAFALSTRIGKNTELNDVVFSGELEEKSIRVIEDAKAFLPDSWHQKMQRIISAHKGQSVNEGIDTADNARLRERFGMITGVLEDSKGKMRRIIEEIQKSQ